MPHACMSGGSGASVTTWEEAGIGKRTQVCSGSQGIAFVGPLGWDPGWSAVRERRLGSELRWKLRSLLKAHSLPPPSSFLFLRNF